MELKADRSISHFLYFYFADNQEEEKFLKKSCKKALPIKINVLLLHPFSALKKGKYEGSGRDEVL